MNYFDIINQAIELVVVDAGNGLSFLEPRYKEVLRTAGLTEHDEVISEEDLYEVLKLEVEKRNAIGNKMNIIAAWVANTIETVIDPAITKEENEFMKNMIDYLERDKTTKEKDLDAIKVLPTEMNFAKKKE